ncbi:helix-turn-helix domain-containing protein [Millisia brevis]|uniref:helix-turn-helix domain-containing protein n=1 Tax=Millisia brevis TaxID=264148 RepID=UPI000833C996|nr:XRE family transcriptional regulator [Millisia brevis]
MTDPRAATTVDADDDPSADAVSGDASGDRARILGSRLRSLREAKGMSLRGLARQLGISPSAVSQIERGLITPSVMRLIGMVEALGAPLCVVLDDEPLHDSTAVGFHAGFSVRRAPGAPVDLTGGVTYRRLSPPLPGTDFFESIYPPGSSSGPPDEYLEHAGIDAGTVTAGRVIVESPRERVELQTGDSIAFDASTPHRITNPDDDKPAILTWLTLHAPNHRHNRLDGHGEQQAN